MTNIKPHGLRGKPSNHRSHGMSNTSEYSVWANMVFRTRARKGKAHKDYASRGIKVCERWLSFENFLADMGPRPSLEHSIERKDNNGNYEPENCVWALGVQQANNTRANHRVTFQNKTLTLAQWSAELKLSERTLWYRLMKYGWTVERALTSPLVPQRLRQNNDVPLTFNGETRSLSQWARHLNVPSSTLFNRRARGWSLERVLTPARIKR